ncbi:MAG TPA: hypothetical protein VMV10_17160 [Pirellulales bacterium]|nr:hypothetical protein [Pirellulales bacterium]
MTVKEAAQRTGKSPSSIRRVIYPILEDPQHPDRPQIQPSVDDARELRLRGENFAWRLSEDLLNRAIPPASQVDPGREPKGAHGAEADLVVMLRRELEIKNQQISQHAELVSRQMELLNALSERLREGNMLLGSLQQRLTLAEKNTAPPVVDAQPTPTKSANPAPPKGKAPAKKPAKRGLLSRWFH